MGSCDPIEHVSCALSTVPSAVMGRTTHIANKLLPVCITGILEKHSTDILTGPNHQGILGNKKVLGYYHQELTIEKSKEGGAWGLKYSPHYKQARKLLGAVAIAFYRHVWAMELKRT